MGEEEPRHDRGLSWTETMMWRIERDPWLAPSGGALSLFDRPLDAAWFRRSLAFAASTIDRLRQHVVSTPATLSTPRWAFDPDFELDWHVRHIGAPGDGSQDALTEWVTQFLQDPYDHTRPLWQYVVVDGLADGRGALVTKLHHTIADGFSGLKLAEAYTALEPNAPMPGEVDWEAVLRRDAEHREPFDSSATELVTRALRMPVDLGRQVLDAVAHPEHLGGAATEATDLAHTVTDQLHPAGSELWRRRSRRRRLLALSVPFEPAHRSAKMLGGTINDLFVTGAVEAGHRYHAAMGADPERFHITFVVSTRADVDTANAFSPVPVDVPAGAMPLHERFTVIHQRLLERRAWVHGGGPMATVAPVANLLPTWMVTNIIRSQAAHIDFATSNLPGFLGDTWVAGARTLHTYGWGPVVGTAFNITQVSMAGHLDIGVHVDPAAVTEPLLLQSCLEESYRDLLGVGPI
ncbi:MAG TPA: wax ester/triacylglycerol synthase domain-containing protein [Acidimicrobiales bacterium]|nr:wax ester/triacylglycerol synthase domain-containing protein [Acidimicrobiales bacterium]